MDVFWQDKKYKSLLSFFYLVILLVALLLLFNNCGGNKKIVKVKKEKPAFAKILEETEWRKVADNLNFPEGPAWNKQKNSLYVSNCYGGWIAIIQNGKTDTFLTASANPFTFDKTNGMTFHNGFLFVCDFGKGEILKVNMSGKTEVYAKSFNNKRFNKPNDLAFDKKGNLYFTDPKSYGKEKLDGRIFMIKSSTKEVVLLDDSLAFPNGIAFTENGKNLFVCESAKNRILKYEVLPDGKLINKSVFVILPGGDPDGIAFDGKGNLYVAHFGTGYLFVINSKGKIIKRIKTPGKKPTNIEFGGSDMKTLYLTEVETNGLYKIIVPEEGITLN